MTWRRCGVKATPIAVPTVPAVPHVPDKIGDIVDTPHVPKNEVISSLTELALFSYAYLSVEEEARLEAFLHRYNSLPLTSNIARMAGDLRRLYPQAQVV